MHLPRIKQTNAAKPNTRKQIKPDRKTETERQNSREKTRRQLDPDQRGMVPGRRGSPGKRSLLRVPGSANTARCIVRSSLMFTASKLFISLRHSVERVFGQRLCVRGRKITQMNAPGWLTGIWEESYPVALVNGRVSGRLFTWERIRSPLKS